MRKTLFPSLIAIGSLLLLLRVFYLQVIDESFKLRSENNAIKIKYEYPERGYIYDRNGKLLVSNQSSYDIMVIPRDVKVIDTIEFCNLLQIDKAYFISKIAKARVYSPRLPSVFLAQLNKSEFAAFQEKIRKFNGFYFQKRALRNYNVDSGANIFGFITQVNEKLIQKNKYYNSGDLIGKQGVEEYYENELRGIKGVKYILKDKYNREIGSYKEGKYDTIAKNGSDIEITIDADLQKYGEELMVNKRGGIVAIEPKTGEILALVTAPSYDPSILVGRERSKNYTKLYRDSLAKPLYDRGLLAEYPPGSPFKILTGLVGLQEEVIDETTSFMCRHGFSYSRGHFMRCHGYGMHQLNNGLYLSCNTYFANVYMRSIKKFEKSSEGMDVWSNHIKSFGLGSFLGYDLPTGRKGKIPSGDTYNRIYPNGGWGSTTTISNAIGQGEVLMTPIQLANMMATVANQGYYYTPHIIRKINQTKNIDPKFKEKHQTTIDKKYFKPVVQGLFDVFNYGTASSLRVKGIDICGKTGTAENFARIDGRRVQLKDHSIFVAFAPKDNPKIAIALLVENAGFGATIAGPIATLMIEKYLNKKISRPDLEKRIINTSLKAQYDRLLGSSKKTATATDSLIAKNNLVKAVKKDTTKVN